MALRKKKAKVKPKPKPKPEPTDSGFVYYRSADGRVLFRVDAPRIPLAPGGGWDLEKVPEGEVSVWTGTGWLPSTLPPVGHGPDEVRHTKNTAGKGV